MRITFSTALLLATTQLVAAATQAPPNTRDFLAYCKNDAKGCEDEIYRNYITMAFESPPETCATKTQLADKIGLRNAIIGWIAKHPSAAGRTSDSVIAAFKAVYPCR